LAIVSPDFSEDLYQERLVLMRLAAEVDEGKPVRGCRHPESQRPVRPDEGVVSMALHEDQVDGIQKNRSTQPSGPNCSYRKKIQNSPLKPETKGSLHIVDHQAAMV
jgi:hypothetical protein